MRIIFSHRFGCHTRSELILSYPELVDVRPEEHSQALEQGWLLSAENPGCKPFWYQSRSTRINLTTINYSFNHEFQLLDKNHSVEELEKIYTLYCNHKHYNRHFEFKEFLDIDFLIGYYHNDNLTAWTKFRQYDRRNIESVMFAWDYRDPSSHLGINSLRAEIAWAKQHNYKYLYMGSGYEKNSIYKSDMNGFEWWTGSAWSQDREEYVRLCKRDSVISSCHQIHVVFSNLQHCRNSP